MAKLPKKLGLRGIKQLGRFTCTSPYLKSRNVQMKKKARFYLGFRICTNVQVKLLFLGFHLYIPSSLVHVCKCRKPHKHWVFRSLVHFLISSRGVPPLSIRAPERRADARACAGRWRTSAGVAPRAIRATERRLVPRLIER